MKVDIKLNHKNIQGIIDKAEEALVDTADAVKSDLQLSKTMPFDTGVLQNDSTFINPKKRRLKKVSIVSDTPYARRLYFHPEYNFKTDKNPYAGGLWFNTYIDGDKKEVPRRIFIKMLKGKLR